MTKQKLDLLLPNQKDISKQTRWIQHQIEDIGQDTLIRLAKKAAQHRKNSYSPYSNYKVGVVLLSQSGKTYLGTNMERASYSETNHAEETSIAAAINAGEAKKNRRFIKAIVVSHPGDSTCCGRCRQIISEYADNCLIINANQKGEIQNVTSLEAILPFSFNPTHLGIK